MLSEECVSNCRSFLLCNCVFASLCRMLGLTYSSKKVEIVDASRFASSINGGTRFLKKPCVTQDPTKKSKS